MAKVYVANLGGHDLSDAERFGELVFLTTRGYRPKYLERVLFEVMEQLRHFDSEQDYFLPVGQDFINITCMWALTQMHDEISVLYWDFPEQKYIVKTYTPRLFHQITRNLKLREELEKHDRFARHLKSY